MKNRAGEKASSLFLKILRNELNPVDQRKFSLPSCYFSSLNADRNIHRNMQIPDQWYYCILDSYSILFHQNKCEALPPA